jgi:hypothetical protein
MAFFFTGFENCKPDMEAAAQNQDKGDSPESTKGITFCTYFVAPLVFPSEGAGFLPRAKCYNFGSSHIAGGSNSVVESRLPKPLVAGSIPVSRSNFPDAFSNPFGGKPPMRFANIHL